MRGDAFYTLRPLLCDNKVVLKHRLRLFSSCVVFSMYWCAGSCLLKILTPQTVLNACDRWHTVGSLATQNTEFTRTFLSDGPPYQTDRVCLAKTLRCSASWLCGISSRQLSADPCPRRCRAQSFSHAATHSDVAGAPRAAYFNRPSVQEQPVPS